MSVLKGKLSTLVKFLFAFGLIGFLVYRGDLNFQVLAKIANPYYFLMGLALSFLNILFNNMRWLYLLRSQKINSTFKDSLQLTLMGIFFNFALPSSIGGDVVKAYYVVKENPHQRMKAATTVIVDRVFGLIIMMAISVVSVIVYWDFVFSHPELSQAATLLILGLLGAIVFLLIAFSKKVRRLNGIIQYIHKIPKLGGFYDALHSYGSDWGAILKAFLMSVGSQLSAIFFMIVMAYAFGFNDLSWGVYFFAIPIGFILMSVPIAPAGIGVGQIVFLYLFQTYTGQKIDVGQLVITAFQLFLLMWGGLGAFYYVKKKKKIEQIGATL
ncbi:MAG: flippase-like domain-containing protein [Bdellovibrionales bacterium]|nr:flippase-like domain-containing protein [Bdellovibrionales bacterium]